MKTVLAVACALGASVLLNYAVYLQKKALGALPAVRLEVSWATFKAFITNRLWMTAMVVSVIGGGLYSVAITLAPVSIVQPIVGSGVALLAYLAITNLGEKPRRIDYFAISLSVTGVVLIGVSLAEGVPKQPAHDPGELWIFAGGMLLAAVVIPLFMRQESRLAAGLGISVGIMFGLVAIFARLLLLDWSNQWSEKGVMVVFSSVFLIAWAVLFIAAFIAFQAALQRGMAVVVVPLVAGLSQLVPIAGGTIALNEAFPKSDPLFAARILAFALILVGTVILSRRAEETGPAEEGEPDTG